MSFWEEELPNFTKTILFGPIFSLLYSSIKSTTSRVYSVDSEMARKEVADKVRSELASAYRSGLAESCSKALEELRTHNLPVAAIAQNGLQGTCLNLAMPFPGNIFLKMQAYNADESEKLLAPSANARWQEFYQKHCTNIEKEKQQLENEVEHLGNLIRHWQTCEAKEK
jgi:hypothetical protein